MRSRTKSPLHERREARDQRSYTSSTVEYRDISPKPADSIRSEELERNPMPSYDGMGGGHDRQNPSIQQHQPNPARKGPRAPPEATGGTATTSTTQHWIATGQHPATMRGGVPGSGESGESLFPEMASGALFGTPTAASGGGRTWLVGSESNPDWEQELPGSPKIILAWATAECQEGWIDRFRAQA